MTTFIFFLYWCLTQDDVFYFVRIRQAGISYDTVSFQKQLLSRTSMFWVFTKCCTHTPMLIQIGKFYRLLSWNLRTFITHRLLSFISDTFVFMITAKSVKHLKIYVEQNSLIICNCHHFCCSDICRISFMNDTKSCF